MNQNKLDQLLAMDDNALRDKATQIAAALGMSEAAATLTETNLSGMRAMLRAMKREDLDRLIASLGAERAQAIFRTFGEDGE